MPWAWLPTGFKLRVLGIFYVCAQSVALSVLATQLKRPRCLSCSPSSLFAPTAVMPRNIPSPLRAKRGSTTATRTRVASAARNVPCSVLIYKTALMQRLADHVRLGYKFWTSGTVEPHRAQALVDKFAHLYGTGLTRHQKAYARAQGQASATLLLWSPTSSPVLAPSSADKMPTSNAFEPTTTHLPPSSAHDQPTTAERETTSPDSERSAVKLHWFLLVTPGEHIAHRLENLRDATTPAGRLALTGYELVTLPRVGQAKPAWTWRMTASTYTAWRQRLVTAARRQLKGLNNEVAELARTPGFAGCRAQVKKLLQLARAEAARRMSPSDMGQVAFPTRIRYLPRVPQKGVALGAWLKNGGAHDRRGTRTNTDVAVAYKI